MNVYLNNRELVGGGGVSTISCVIVAHNKSSIFHLASYNTKQLKSRIKTKHTTFLPTKFVHFVVFISVYVGLALKDKSVSRRQYTRKHILHTYMYIAVTLTLFSALIVPLLSGLSLLLSRLCYRCRSRTPLRVMDSFIFGSRVSAAAALMCISRRPCLLRLMYVHFVV